MGADTGCISWYLHVPLQPYNIQLLHNQQKNLLGLTVSSEMNQALVQHHWNVRRLSVVSIVSAATLEAVAKYINFPNPALNTLILIFTPRTDSGLPFFSSDRAVLPRMKHPWSYFNPEYDKDSDNDGTPATLSELLIRCLPMVGMQLGIALPKLTRLALHSCTGVGAVLRHWINLGAGAVALKWLSVVVQGGQSEECEADVHAFVRSFSGLHVLIIMLTHGAHTTLGDLARHLDTLYQLKLEFLIRVDSTFRPVMYASPEFLKGLRARAPPHLRELAVLVNRDCFDHMPDGIMGCVPLSVQYLQLGEMNGNIHDYGELLFGPHFPFCQGGFPENRVLALTGDVQGNQGVILQRGTLVGSGKLVKGRKPSLFYVQHVPNVLGKMQLLVTPLAEQEATELVGEIGLLSKWSKWSKW